MHEEPPTQISFSMVPSGSSTTFQLQFLQIAALWYTLQINSRIAQFSVGHGQKNPVCRFVERCPQDTQLQNTLKAPRWWEYFWSVFPTEVLSGKTSLLFIVANAISQLSQGSFLHFHQEGTIMQTIMEVIFTFTSESGSWSRCTLLPTGYSCVTEPARRCQDGSFHHE